MMRAGWNSRISAQRSAAVSLEVEIGIRAVWPHHRTSDLQAHKHPSVVLHCVKDGVVALEVLESSFKVKALRQQRD
jgi:hypothetical protein